MELNLALRAISASEEYAPLMALLDLEDAFPRVKRRAIDRILAKAGFSGELRQQVKNIYFNVGLYVVLDGRLLTGYVMREGLGQGCRLSSLLLPLAMETFTQYIFSCFRSKQL